MDVIAILAGIIVGVGLLAWLGLQIRPEPFAPFPLPSSAPELVPLAQGLPAPVERFYRRLYGEDVPLITSAVISGRGRLRFNGIRFPARFRFTHITGQDYRHYIEVTFLGLPLLKVNEYFLDGRARMELPFGVSEGPNVDQGANLALWAEAVWMPAVWITDPQARWEATERDGAELVVPFAENEERFTAHFDAESGMLRSLQSLRYKGAGDESKTPWLNEVLEWGSVKGQTVPVETAVTWSDEGSPWAVFRTEEVIYNADVQEYVRARGP